MTSTLTFVEYYEIIKAFCGSSEEKWLLLEDYFL